MKKPAVVMICCLLGLQCARRGNIVEIGGYTFQYDGQEYRIQSVTPTLAEGYNVLTRRENDQLVIKALDREQDGILDEIQTGNLTMDEANTIYQEGIAEGERRGYIKKRTFAREYRYSDTMYHYVLATYVLAMGDVYNKLTITDRQLFKSPGVVIDENADGILDHVEEGLDNIGEYQKLYRHLLDAGMRVNRIIKNDGKYLVAL
ncbi:hypothetical protein JW948_09745 [bacterium]|nr:hypothetical protein [bacterium]